jgi:hypothetical protein
MNEKLQNISYRFDDIIVLGFNFQEYGYEKKEIFERMQLEFESGFRANKEKNLIVFDLGISATSEINYEDSSSKNIDCFHIKLRNTFFVDGLTDSTEKDLFKENREFIVTLASLSYSTSRGILKEKLSDTRYSDNFILPIVDPNQFVSGEEEKSLEKD